MAVLDDIEKFAHLLLNERKQIYCGPRERAITTLDRFPQLNHEIYAQGQIQFEKHGFTFVADIVDETLAHIAPDLQTMYRIMLGDDGATYALVAHVRSTGRLRLLQRELEILSDAAHVTNVRRVMLESEFNDGTWLETTNTRERHPPAELPRVTILRFQKHATVDHLVAAHREKLAELTIPESKRHFVRQPTIADILASLQRQDILESNFRRSVGYVMPQEIERMFGDRWYPWAIRKLQLAIAKIQLEESKGESI